MHTEGDEYYEQQSAARGIRSEADVVALVEQMDPVYRRFLPAWLSSKRDARIHEAACGPGIMLRWLRSQGFTNLTACDLSGPEVALARAAGFSVEHDNAVTDLARRETASLDAVIAIDFIEHISKDQLLQFFRETFRALRPGGCLILRAPNGDSPVVGRNLFNDITHIWAYTTTALNALLRINGFREVAFLDDTLVAIQHHRWLRVPLMRAAQVVFKLVLRLATRENLACIGSSYYVCARK